MEWTILFMGPVGVGKSRAIRSISDIDVVDTDVEATDEARRLKPLTTVAMDMGLLRLGGQDRVRVLGAPGQERFDFMWELLLAQAKGVVLLLDQRHRPSAELDRYLDAIERCMPGRRVPLVLGLTHLDGLSNMERQYALATVREHLGTRWSRIALVQPPVLGLDARIPEQVRAVLLAMTALIEMGERFGTPARATLA